MSGSDGAEIWRPIKGYPKYFISSHGRVRSFMRGKGKIMVCDGDKYLRVGLSNYLGVKKFLVHRLVATAFTAGHGMEVNHLDGNGRNNFANNLEWVSKSENVRHAYKIGKLCRKGENNGKAKLSAKDVREIRRRASRGDKGTAISSYFNISRSVISGIKNRKIWTHIE